MLKQSWRQLSQHFNEFKQKRALIKRGLFEYDIVIPKSGDFKGRPGRVDYVYRKSVYGSREVHVDIIYYYIQSRKQYANIQRDNEAISNLILWHEPNQLVRPLVVGDYFYAKEDFGIYLFSIRIGQEGKKQRVDDIMFREKQTLYVSGDGNIFHEYNIDVARTNQHILKTYNTKVNPELPNL